MSVVVIVTDSSFGNDVLKAKLPVLVAFRAEWSGVCRALDPVLADIAKDFGGRLVVARLDIDESPQTGPRYNVTAIPTLHVFKGGAIVATRVGPASKANVAELVKPHL
ncbi:thioredoxin family protein [Streptomyces clavuligerus]|nr:thioredoxin domain-containing protein [Streptomyces clavuligerus]ANW22394.1 thiol reductase thioredoxin [Streptomyces clavuligerus]AXU17299.1 thiol reductase thioredoxin [Streptomyces clavuligerus]EDY47534.1 thioredoxin [Streptomyces clavuligerus]MBY6307054.1 thiol reductase thioredoxin [Streptomyces clavuligerus]QCS10368.1 thiol reductase thioredoxin [Streptomyces clavuligerus]